MADSLRREFVVPMRERWLCGINDCLGEMKSTGSGVRGNFKPEWDHKCDTCKREQRHEFRYPRIVYEPSE